MTLTVETGAIVTGANSYVSRADAIAYAANRGVTLADTTATDAMLIKATDYLETYADRFKGILVDREQPLSWPRYDAVIEGFSWESDEIPRQVVNAQLAVLLEINAGDDPFNPTPVVGPVTEKTVSGAVTVRYASGTSSKVKKSRASDAIIALLLSRSGLMAVRA